MNGTLKLIYITGAFMMELLAYALLIGLCIHITDEQYGKISTISDALALSVDITIYYVFIIYVFAIGRNGYEFYIDPNDRLDAWKNNIGLYIAICIRIILLNIMLLMLMLIGAVTIYRDNKKHDNIALSAIIFHLLYEFTCIGIRSYYAHIGNMEIITNKTVYILFLCFEAIMVIVAVLYGLCFIGTICVSNTQISIVSEYLLFATVISTPIFRILD